jgi:hypothetical protein
MSVVADEVWDEWDTRGRELTSSGCVQPIGPTR